MKGFNRKIYYWIYDRRPWVLLTTVAATIAFVALLNWWTDSDLFRQFFHPEDCEPKLPAKCVPDPLEWKELFQAAVVILGLPVAFLIWHWRDVNVREQIQNARKDTNLKEFQEVQLRAAGIVPNDTSDNAKNVLQVAALHQLRPFLKGDYGDDFKRPAFETYCALLMHRNEADCDPAEVDLLPVLAEEIFKAIRSIVYEDWKWFFWENYDARKPWPLEGRSFHAIELPMGADLGGLSLSRANFYKSKLESVSFEECQCQETIFNECDLRGAIFKLTSCEEAKFDRARLDGAQAFKANFSRASLNQTWFREGEFFSSVFQNVQGADCVFSNSDLENTDFKGAKFKDVDFEGANLKNSSFVNAQMSGCNISSARVLDSDLSSALFLGAFPEQAHTVEGTIVNSKTQFSHRQIKDSESKLSSERKATLLEWINLGAKMVDPTSEWDDPEVKMIDDQIIAARKKSLEIEKMQQGIDAVAQTFNSGSKNSKSNV